jgi:nucleotide-binding universal stress UspA family protein
MHTFAKVLVPVDFSPTSRHALRRAVEIARRGGAHLVLQTVVEQRELNTLSFMYRGDDLDRQLTERFDGALARALLEAGGDDVEAERIVTLGTPFLEVLKAGHSVGADLIVVPSRAGGALDALVPLANTTYKVLRQASCSVYSVAPADDREDAAGPTILVAVDFSAHSRAALCRAGALAGQLQGRLHLVYALDGSSDAQDADPQGALQAFAASCGLDDADLTLHVAGGSPVGAIVKTAESVRADLIVMGSHGRANVLKGLLLGDTVYQVVRRAATSVIVVKGATSEGA